MTNIMKKLQETVDNADCRIILKADLSDKKESARLAAFITGMSIVNFDIRNRIFYLFDKTVRTFYTLSILADYQAGQAVVQLIYSDWGDDDDDSCFGIPCVECNNRKVCGIE